MGVKGAGGGEGAEGCEGADDGDGGNTELSCRRTLAQLPQPLLLLLGVLGVLRLLPRWGSAKAQNARGLAVLASLDSQPAKSADETPAAAAPRIGRNRASMGAIEKKKSGARGQKPGGTTRAQGLKT